MYRTNVLTYYSPSFRSRRRFLRARQFNLEKTKTMFDNFYKWRKEFDINDLRENFDFPEWREVQKMWPQCESDVV